MNGEKERHNNGNGNDNDDADYDNVEIILFVLGIPTQYQMSLRYLQLFVLYSFCLYVYFCIILRYLPGLMMVVAGGGGGGSGGRY